MAGARFVPASTVHDNTECAEGGDDGCGTVFAVFASSK
jgi:hypothetical protein